MAKDQHPAKVGLIIHVFMTIFVLWICFTIYAKIEKNRTKIFDYSPHGIWLIVSRTLIFTTFSASLIMLLKVWTNTKYSETSGIEQKQRYKRLYLIGSAGASIHSFIMYYTFCNAELTDTTLPIVFFTCNISMIMLYFAFIWRSEKLYLVETDFKPAIIGSVIWLLMWLVPLTISIKDDPKDFSYIRYALSYVLSGFAGSSFLSGFIGVLMGRMMLLEDKTPIELEDVMTSKDLKRNGNGISCTTVDETSQLDTKSLMEGHDCEICFTKYNEHIPTQIPRILAECGHTICGGCIDNLLKQNIDYIKCPFCQKVTTVHGSSDALPKNFGIIKLIR